MQKWARNQNQKNFLRGILTSSLMIFVTPNLYAKSINQCAALFQPEISVSNVLNSAEIIKQKGRERSELDIFELTKGQEIYVLPVAFANNVHLSQKILEPIKMKVVSIKSTKEGKRFHLENAETGVVQFTFKDLYEIFFQVKKLF